MGVIISQTRKAAELTKSEVVQLWDQVDASCNNTWLQANCHPLGWNSVHLIVCSTLKDFAAERSVLHKEVFPRLRAWCATRDVDLVVSDMNVGVPPDVSQESFTEASLNEIEQASTHNGSVFFLCMISERCGYIPNLFDISPAVVGHYDMKPGLSQVEHEVVYAAYRSKNPNALFMIRDPLSLNLVPVDRRTEFVDSNPLSSVKLNEFKTRIRKRFPANQVHTYLCKANGIDQETNCVAFQELTQLKVDVYEFFEKRFIAWFDVPDVVPSQDTESVAELLEVDQMRFLEHQCGLKYVQRTEDVVDEVVSDLMTALQDTIDHIKQSRNEGGEKLRSKFVITGKLGCGRTRVLAQIVNAVQESINKDRRFNSHSKRGQTEIFYHIPSATPGVSSSHSVNAFLKRLYRFLRCSAFTDREDFTIRNTRFYSEAIRHELSMPVAVPRIAFIDDIDKFGIELISSILPDSQASLIIVGTSTVLDVKAYADYQIYEVCAYSIEQVKNAWTSHHGEETVVLDEEGTEDLSTNAGWVHLATHTCYSSHAVLAMVKESNTFHKLISALLQMCDLQAGYSAYFAAALCLLSSSPAGLLENELRDLLAVSNVLPPAFSVEDSTDKTKVFSQENVSAAQLSSFVWCRIRKYLLHFAANIPTATQGNLFVINPIAARAILHRYYQYTHFNKLKAFNDWWNGKLINYFQTSKISIRRCVCLPNLLALHSGVDAPEFLRLIFTKPIVDHYCSVTSSEDLLTAFGADSFTQTLLESIDGSLLNMRKDCVDPTFMQNIHILFLEMAVMTNHHKRALVWVEELLKTTLQAQESLKESDESEQQQKKTATGIDTTDDEIIQVNETAKIDEIGKTKSSGNTEQRIPPTTSTERKAYLHHMFAQLVAHCSEAEVSSRQREAFDRRKTELLTMRSAVDDKAKLAYCDVLLAHTCLEQHLRRPIAQIDDLQLIDECISVVKNAEDFYSNKNVAMYGALQCGEIEDRCRRFRDEIEDY